MIQAVHHVQISIPVGSEDEARAFYCGVLGMSELPKPDSLAGRGGFWLEIEAHLAYLVSDLKGWRKKLAANGCSIIDGIQIPGFDRFEFRDPFENRVELLERKH